MYGGSRRPGSFNIFKDLKLEEGTFVFQTVLVPSGQSNMSLTKLWPKSPFNADTTVITCYHESDDLPTNLA